MTTLEEKLARNKNHIILCADIDGTIFTAGWKILFAPFWNLRTAKILKENSIPLILVTGRSGWTKSEDLEISLHGLSKADIVISSAGCLIYHRLSNGSLQKDIQWEKKIAEVKIDRKECKNTILSYFRKMEINIKQKKDTPYLLRFFLPKIHTSILFQIKKDLENLLPKNLQVIFTDKLLYHNTERLFAGDMLIIPRIAGKDNAVTYVLERIKNTPFSPYIFGDALIDIQMLSLASTKNYTLFSFLVHPTPLGKKSAKENKNITIIDSEGPQAILSVMQKAVSQFSPAQNSITRKLLLPLEPLLNKILPKHLSPNEISFLGLEKVKRGIDRVYLHNNFFVRIQGLLYYSFGLTCDLLDGIRARRSGKKEPNGQLIDGYCDRAEEFYQLYTQYSSQKKETILFAALSCVLPSIARAQAEIQNILVAETDEKGGSRSSRVRKLFVLLFLNILNAHKKSEAIAQKIYSTNIATFQNRLSYIPNTKFRIPNTLNYFQVQALERFLLYVQLFQEELEITEKFIPKEKLEKWNKENNLEYYLDIDINSERKKNRFQDYNLRLASY